MVDKEFITENLMQEPASLMYKTVRSNGEYIPADPRGCYEVGHVYYQRAGRGRGNMTRTHNSQYWSIIILTDKYLY